VFKEAVEAIDRGKITAENSVAERKPKDRIMGNDLKKSSRLEKLLGYGSDPGSVQSAELNHHSLRIFVASRIKES